MNDITWREPGDENEILIAAYPSERVIVQTDITYRIDLAQYIETNRWPWRLRTAGENVIRFAFLGD
jgi:hypothetical protein